MHNQINISDMNVEQLKALGYDLLTERETLAPYINRLNQLNSNLVLIASEIKERVEPITETK